MLKSIFAGSLAVALLLFSSVASAQPHRVLLQGNDRLAIVAADGSIEWEMPWSGIHDIHLLENGHILAQRGSAEIAEIDPQTKQVVWSYDSSKQNGNAGKRVEVHSFQPLQDGRLMIAESGPARIIEIDREGNLLKEIPLVVNHPDPHTDTRLVRKLANGNYLVCHEADGFVREYDGESGEVIWSYEVPLFGQEQRDGHDNKAFGNKLFAAVRLTNGHTLIATGNGHSVIEVREDGMIMDHIKQLDLNGIVLAWVTTLEVLPNGHIVLGNCHAGPGQPQLIQVNPTTHEVVWSLERYEEFGNNVSNSLLLDVEGGTLR